MSDDDGDSIVRSSRPSLAQVRALVDFVEKHPDLAHKKLRMGVSRQKVKKHWIQISNILNAIDGNGTMKSTKGWMKFWYDKKRTVVLKHKEKLCPIERRIYELSAANVEKPRTRKLKYEECNGDDGYLEDMSDEMNMENSKLPTEAEERQLNLMDKLVDVMGQQASAMAQIAQATHNNSKALERFAEASHLQALAVDRVASTFENMNGSVNDVRNSLMSIDYSMKRCYSSATPQQLRQNSNIFS